MDEALKTTHRVLIVYSHPSHRGGGGQAAAMDNFTNLLRKTSYARVRVEIDARLLLKLGIWIRSKKRVFWQ